MKKDNQKRILIVNRGEIAIRVARAVRELGHLSVGLLTNYETNAAHLAFCDEWVELSGNNHSETYLNIKKIINIMSENNIDAVHPGYGFLAENSNFASEVEKIGKIFIGPSAEVIRVMGDKAISKNCAAEAGIPIIPGSKSEVKDLEEAKKYAQEIGYPVLLKAVAGGGGRGLRACISEEELLKNYEVVKRESKSSFGHDGLLVEKLIENPHHIEVQVFGLNNGEVLHFFERECSVQRRNQKIIEEAPSPFIGEDENVRNKICNDAVKLAKHVGYKSAGTVEFVMDSKKNYYFLEMNTRIQVEHPITEEITNSDLISMMIQNAFNEKLDFEQQSEIKMNGHAIECRICAEDPITMMPSPGKVHKISFEIGNGQRFDHCLYNGCKISSSFDPMVGKLVSKGHNRSIALRKMNYALNGLNLTGMKTNRHLHLKILNNDTFQKGNYTTKFLENLKPQDELKSDLNERFEKAKDVNYVVDEMVLSAAIKEIENSF